MQEKEEVAPELSQVLGTAGKLERMVLLHAAFSIATQGHTVTPTPLPQTSGISGTQR